MRNVFLPGVSADAKRRHSYKNLHHCPLLAGRRQFLGLLGPTEVQKLLRAVLQALASTGRIILEYSMAQSIDLATVINSLIVYSCKSTKVNLRNLAACSRLGRAFLPEEVNRAFRALLHKGTSSTLSRLRYGRHSEHDVSRWIPSRATEAVLLK